MHGYQLVAKSSGVDRNCGQDLCRWAPTQPPSENPSDWTINCFPLSDDRIAVTRTALGGPEYSCRGGVQVVTLILLLKPQQFQQYDGDAITIAKTALALGYLRLPLEMSREHLDKAVLPKQPMIVSPSLGHCRFRQEAPENLLSEAHDLIGQGRRVALVGLAQPIEAAADLISTLSTPEREHFSFTTGLPPTLSRPFQAHFLPTVDASRRRLLASQNIVCLGSGAAAPVGVGAAI
jgi:hypothetical protein